MEISFRPFTLRDLAWFERTYTTDQDRVDLAAQKAEAIAKIVWHMLTPESKQTFCTIKFEDFNEETEEIIEVSLTGYEKLLFAMNDLVQLLKAYAVLATSKSMNDFYESLSPKKKTKA